MGFFSCVSHLVSFQNGFELALKFTFVTAIRLQCTVFSFMSRQCALLSGFEFTLITLVWFFACMYHHMSFPKPYLLEWRTTDIALNLYIFNIINFHVFCHGIVLTARMFSPVVTYLEHDSKYKIWNKSFIFPLMTNWCIFLWWILIWPWSTKVLTFLGIAFTFWIKAYGRKWFYCFGKSVVQPNNTSNLLALIESRLHKVLPWKTLIFLNTLILRVSLILYLIIWFMFLVKMQSFSFAQ